MGYEEVENGLEWSCITTGNLNELDEFHLKAYESSSLYKEKMKKYHDQKIEKREFMVGDLVLLYNSKLRLFPSKLKSKLTALTWLPNYSLMEQLSWKPRRVCGLRWMDNV